MTFTAYIDLLKIVYFVVPTLIIWTKSWSQKTQSFYATLKPGKVHDLWSGQEPVLSLYKSKPSGIVYVCLNDCL